MGRKKKMEIDIINHHAASIDIGSRSHFVAAGQSLEDAKCFGVYAEDLIDIWLWLKSYDIKTVAIKSTDDYWQNLYTELVKNDFEVILVNGKFTKNAKGKKTDVKDCRWIQKLHVLGLLATSFVHYQTTAILRTYCRHRNNWIDSASAAYRKMQKYLKFLNFRLDAVVKDVFSLIGLTIIEYM